MLVRKDISLAPTYFPFTGTNEMTLPPSVMETRIILALSFHLRNKIYLEKMRCFKGGFASVPGLLP